MIPAASLGISENGYWVGGGTIGPIMSRDRPNTIFNKWFRVTFVIHSATGLSVSIGPGSLEPPAEMVITNFSGAGVGFGFGVGCGFGVGWGFGGTPLNILGLGLGGGCGVGLGLGWGFGTAYGSQYHSSGVTFHGIEVGKKDHEQKSNQDTHASQ